MAINYLQSPFFYAIFHLYKITFSLLCFPIYNNVYPKYFQSHQEDVCQWNKEILSLKTIAKELDFLSNYSMKCLRKRLIVSNKLIEKIPNPGNDKEHSQSFVRTKNTKSAKLSKIITN